MFLYELMKYLKIYENWKHKENTKHPFIQKLMKCVSNIDLTLSELTYTWKSGINHDVDLRNHMGQPYWFNDVDSIGIPKIATDIWEEEIEVANDYMYDHEFWNVQYRYKKEFTKKEYIISITEIIKELESYFLELKELHDNIPREFVWYDITNTPLQPFKYSVSRELPQLVEGVQKWAKESIGQLAAVAFENRLKKAMNKINTEDIKKFK